MYEGDRGCPVVSCSPAIAIIRYRGVYCPDPPALHRRVQAQDPEAAEQCTKPGELGALLRREGLYTSHLAAWRAAARRGELAGLAQRRGPKPAIPDPSVKRIAALERQLARATARAERLEIIVGVQKNCPAALFAPFVGQKLFNE